MKKMILNFEDAWIYRPFMAQNVSFHKIYFMKMSIYLLPISYLNIFLGLSMSYNFWSGYGCRNFVHYMVNTWYNRDCDLADPLPKFFL